MPTATVFPDQASLEFPVQGWGEPQPIDASLFQECRRHFNGSVIREIVLAAAGIKVSRLWLNNPGKVELQRLAGCYRFSALEGRLGYFSGNNTYKGNFINSARLTSSDASNRFTFTYVARHFERAARARDMAEDGDVNGFGELLGIPGCCRDAYRRLEPIARRIHGDLVPQVWKNTLGDQPFDPWINVVVRYFGSNLISFFPCSFRCCAAHSVAKHSYRLLREVSPDWADSLINHQTANVLYTEHQGIHAIRSPIRDRIIRYSIKQLVSTQNTRATELIRRGNRLEIINGQSVAVLRDAIRIGTIEGRNVFVCLFHYGSDHQGLA
jgi:hypothetical protein